MHNVVPEISEIVDWIQLGLQLGLKLPRLREIQANYHTVEECRVNMIHWWLISTEEPTWEKLASAIARLGLAHISLKMSTKFQIESGQEIAFDGKDFFSLCVGWNLWFPVSLKTIQSNLILAFCYKSHAAVNLDVQNLSKLTQCFFSSKVPVASVVVMFISYLPYE